MNWDKAAMAFVNGAGFGLLPVGWTIFSAMLVYNITVETGHFDVVRRSVAGLSGDARIQAVLIGFAFGAFLEGAAGGGTPVAICGAIMVGLGFDPFLAAVLCLIANTSPVAYGGLGTPIITLNGVTDLHTQTLSIMAGHQLPLISFFIPLYMVKCMCSWRKTFEIWPVLLVAGGSFAVFQFVFATTPLFGVELYPMTDIGGGIFSLVLTAIFLRFWRPRVEWHFGRTPAEVKAAEARAEKQAAEARAAEGRQRSRDPHAAEAGALLGPPAPNGADALGRPLTAGRVMMAWAPFAIMSLLLLLSGLVRAGRGQRPRLRRPGAHQLPDPHSLARPADGSRPVVASRPPAAGGGAAGRRPGPADRLPQRPGRGPEDAAIGESGVQFRLGDGARLARVPCRALVDPALPHEAARHRRRVQANLCSNEHPHPDHRADARPELHHALRRHGCDAGRGLLDGGGGLSVSSARCSAGWAFS